MKRDAGMKPKTPSAPTNSTLARSRTVGAGQASVRRRLRVLRAISSVPKRASRAATVRVGAGRRNAQQTRPAAGEALGFGHPATLSFPEIDPSSPPVFLLTPRQRTS